MRAAFMKRAVLALLAAFAGVLMFASAHGAEANLCRLNVTPLRFGKYNPFTPGVARGLGSITYNCTTGSPISIALEPGASALVRRMTQGATPLAYNLYLDAACTMVWGDGTGGTQIFRDPAPAPNSNITVPIYGCIPAGQRSAILGTYFDNFIVTIHY
jgi:spore coat protein U-like protein